METMVTNYPDKIKIAYDSGHINQYMRDKLCGISESGMTQDLMDDLAQDAISASEIGVSSDKDYNLYFFINHFIDDIMDDTFGTQLSPEERKDLCYYLFSHKDDKNFDFRDLTDVRILVHKWLCDKVENKKAYPNTVGMYKRNPIYNLDAWVNTLKNIYNDAHTKNISKDFATSWYTKGWDSDEKRNFINWMKYYESGNTEKYNVKNAKFVKEALGETGLSVPESWLRQRNVTTPQMSTIPAPTPQQTQKEREMELARKFKSKMKSRLRSLRKLLDSYNDIMSSQELDKLYDEISLLEKSISRLSAHATMQDCIIRSAARFETWGFKKEADFLYATAEETPNSILQSLPQQMESPEPDLPHGSTAVSIQSVISRLEGISKLLKSRDAIRELASIDILLNELGLASYFPELTDAQAKLIESFGYASNKIESIVAKLRGTGPKKPDAKPQPLVPPIKMPEIQVTKQPKQEIISPQDIMTKPVGKIEQKLPPTK